MPLNSKYEIGIPGGIGNCLILLGPHVPSAGFPAQRPVSSLPTGAIRSEHIHG